MYVIRMLPWTGRDFYLTECRRDPDGGVACVFGTDTQDALLYGDERTAEAMLSGASIDGEIVELGRTA